MTLLTPHSNWLPSHVLFNFEQSWHISDVHSCTTGHLASRCSPVVQLTLLPNLMKALVFATLDFNRLLACPNYSRRKKVEIVARVFIDTP